MGGSTTLRRYYMQVHSSWSPGGRQTPGQASSLVPSQVSNGGSTSWLPQTGAIAAGRHSSRVLLARMIGVPSWLSIQMPSTSGGSWS
jgi:hypothetical protein